jgi:mRNA interferase RelE/StbE
VTYQLAISGPAKEELRQLPRDVRRNIGHRLNQLRENLAGDVKKLEGRKNHYRLRVGVYRVLFRLNGSTIEVYAVKQRNEAYG